MRKLVLSCLVGLLAFAGLAGVAGAQAPLVMTVAPTSGPAGTTLVFTPTDPCPVSRSVPSATADLSASGGGATLASSAVDANGGWSISYTVPASTSPGSLSFVVTCQGQSVTGGNVVLGVYSAVSFTVETTTTSTTSTTTPGSPTLRLGSTSAVQGGAIDLTSSGWQPGATITITLNSTPVQVGSAVADAVGDVATQVFVPIDFPVGQHTVTLTGLNFAGVAASVSSAITVGAAVVGQSATNTTARPAAATTTSAALPVTGRFSLPLAIAAVALIVGGGSLVLAARRRAAAAALVRVDATDRPR